MKMNKEKFLKTEVGAELKNCIISWDKALEKRRTIPQYTEEYRRIVNATHLCNAQWKVYKMMLRQFYGIEYNFTRTDEYFGLVTNEADDEADWLFKIERQEN